jgi:hypothetical protein
MALRCMAPHQGKCGTCVLLLIPWMCEHSKLIVTIRRRLDGRRYFLGLSWRFFLSCRAEGKLETWVTSCDIPLSERASVDRECVCVMWHLYVVERMRKRKRKRNRYEQVISRNFQCRLSTHGHLSLEEATACWMQCVHHFMFLKKLGRCGIELYVCGLYCSSNVGR